MPRLLLSLTGFLMPFWASLSVVYGQYAGNFQTNIIVGAEYWPGDYYVGSNFVADALDVTGGALLSSTNGWLGYGPSASNNLVLISDPGSFWTNSGVMTIGYNSMGNTLAIMNGGMLGDEAGSLVLSNSVLVSGSNSVWANSGNLSVGIPGPWSALTISNGGMVVNVHSYIGSNSSGHTSNNLVLVTGSGSLWTNWGYLTIAGTATSLIISNGGRVGDYVGILEATQSMAVVSGIGSSWYNYNGLTIGGRSNALIIADGAQVYSDTGYIESVPNVSNATVTVSGPGSIWNAFSFYAGYNFNGTLLLITNGGAVSDVYGYFGTASNSVVVSGVGSSWSNQAGLNFEYWGNNLLVITNGGVVSASISQISASYAYSSNNTILVTGSGSRLSGGLTLGNSTPGNALIITNGGDVYDVLDVGLDLAGSNNWVMVTDPGSVLTNSGDLNVGFDASGNRLMISNGAAVYGVNGYIGVGNGSNNQVLVEGSGASWNNQASLLVGAYYNGGNRLTIGTGCSVFAATAAVEPGFAAPANNELELQGGSLVLQSNLTVYTNAMLRGCGTLAGDLLVQSGGSVAADCDGRLSILGNFTNYGTIWLMNSGVLQVNGTMVNNGTIRHVNGGGSTAFLGSFINNGSVVSNTVTISRINWPEFDIVQAPSVKGLQYQLQFSSSLSPPVWTNSNFPYSNFTQMGSGGSLIFTDMTLYWPYLNVRPNRFYRVRATVP